MSVHEIAAVIAAAALTLMSGFQLSLAAGLPLGHAAWGGRHRVLPATLRVGSLVSAAVLAFAVWVILARAGVIGTDVTVALVRVAAWAFTAFLCLNTLGNLASRSPLERNVMTPLTLVLAVCFALVALS